MSSWIKLDQSFSKVQNRNDRQKRIHQDVQAASIEDDSSQESFSFSPKKKRKLEPLANVTITNLADSSEESCDVDYDPDGVQLPTTKIGKPKPTLPIITSTMQPQQSSTSNIEHSSTDSDEPSTQDTVIDESSTDGSMITSQIDRQQETLIETQESITPPVQPFLANTKCPKKRKVRMIKGGMVERFKKCMSQARSSVSFWHHHRSAELIASGAAVTVHRVENTYGRILIHTKVNDEETIFCLCSKSLDVQTGDIIEVKLDSDRSYKTDTHVLYAYVDKVLLIKRNV